MKPCRRCHDCIGLSHHWMPGFDDGDWAYSPDPRPIWACKHCDFTMPMDADDIDGEHVEELFARHTNMTKPNITVQIDPDPPTEGGPIRKRARLWDELKYWGHWLLSLAAIALLCMGASALLAFAVFIVRWAWRAAA